MTYKDKATKPDLARVKCAKTKEQIVERLQHRIVRWVWLPGSWIPSEGLEAAA